MAIGIHCHPSFCENYFFHVSHLRQYQGSLQPSAGMQSADQNCRTNLFCLLQSIGFPKFNFVSFRIHDMNKLAVVKRLNFINDSYARFT